MGGEVDDRWWDGWMASPTRWTWVWVNSGSWWWTAGLACCSPWGPKQSDTTELLNWTELNCNERWGPSIEKQSAHSFLHFTSHKYLVEHLDIVAVVTFGKTTSLASPRRVIVIHIYQENFPYFGLTNHESKMVRRWLLCFWFFFCPHRSSWLKLLCL